MEMTGAMRERIHSGDSPAFEKTSSNALRSSGAEAIRRALSPFFRWMTMQIALPSESVTLPQPLSHGPGVCGAVMGSKALDDDSAFEFDHLRPVLEPLQRGLILGVDPVLEPVILGRIQRGRVLAPFTANPNGVEFELGAAGVFKLFKVREQSAAGGDAELRLPASVAEGVDEHVFGDGLFHGLNRALIARQMPPVSRWHRAGNQRRRMMPAASIALRQYFRRRGGFSRQ